MKIEWLWAPGVAIVTAATPAHAVQYLNLEQVQRALFASATEFVARPLLLDDAQRDAVAKRAEVRVRDPQLRVWEARDATGLLGYVMVDEVTGKHEFITYALALSPQGKVLGVEVMDYRESYGGQIRDERWRAQFTGKTVADTLRLERDIKNISGATLSCSHLTDGIRRLLISFDIAVKTRA